MEGFVEFHDQLRRAYAESRYGTPYLGKLTKQENAELDLVFNISAGCTDGKGDLDGILNKLLGVLPVNKMSGAQVASLLIVAVLSVAGCYAFKDWLASDLEKERMRSANSSADTNARLISKFIDALHDKDLPPEAARIRARAVDGYRAIAKGAPDASSMEIHGDHYDAQDLQRVRDTDPAARHRKNRTDEVLIGMIKKGKSSLALTLTLSGSDKPYPSKIDLATFDPKDIAALYDSMRDEKAIRIQQYAVLAGDEILSSSLLAVDR